MLANMYNQQQCQVFIEYQHLMKLRNQQFSTEVIIHYNYYTITIVYNREGLSLGFLTTTTVPSAIGIDQKLTTAQYHAITHSRLVDLVPSINTITLSTSTHTFRVPYPTTTLTAATTTSTLSSPTTTEIIIPYPSVTQTPKFSYRKITSEPQDKTVITSVYRLPLINEAQKWTISTEVITHYSYYTTTIVPSAIGVDQQLTTAQYKAITRSRPVDLVSSVSTIPYASAFRVPYLTITLSSAITILTLSSPTTTTTVPYPSVTQTPMFSYRKITSEPQDRTVITSVYRLPMINEAQKWTISTEVTTHYSYYTTTTVPSAIEVDQQLTTAQYKAIIRSRPVDLVSSVSTIPYASAFRVPYLIITLSSAITISTLSSPTTTTAVIIPYPSVTQTPMFDYPKTTSELQDRTVPAMTEYQRTTNKKHHLSTVYILRTTEGITTGSPTDTGTTIDTDPSLSATADKKSHTVTLRETVAWALLSLMILLFIGLLSVNVTVLCMHKCRQKRDNTAQAPAYEMAGNPCYESSKISNALQTDIYESIVNETERVYI